MKVLHINSYYFSSSVHHKLHKALLDSKIISYTYVPLSYGYIIRDECRNIFINNVLKSECYYKIDRFIFYLKHYKIYKDFKNKINIKDYSFIHAHSLFSNGYIAYKTKLEFGLPYIVTIRGKTDIYRFFKYVFFLRKLGIKILLNADKIIFLSKVNLNYLLNKYIPNKYKDEILKKAVIIPNGIDDFWFLNIGENKKLVNNNKLNLLYVGLINKNKNILTTIKACETLIDKGYDINFSIVGKVIDKKIFNIIKSKSFIKYYKPCNKEKLIHIYRTNDIFVMPSISETFGLVYVEAMSQGLPVIYTKGQGFDGQFNEGIVGYHVETFNYLDIVDKIIKIKSFYEEISVNCISLCTSFKWDKILFKYKELYKNLFIK